MRRQVFFCSCLWAVSFTLPADAQKGVTVKDLFPLKEGNKWVYALGKKEVEITVEKSEKREVVRKDDKGQDKIEKDVESWRLQITRSDKQKALTEVVAVLPDGVYRLEAAGKLIEPPLCFIKFANKWEVKAVSETVKLEGTFTLTTEKIKVPKYSEPIDTYRITCPRFTLGQEKMAIDIWLKPGVGMVKQRIEIDNHDVLVLELKTCDLK